MTVSSTARIEVFHPGTFTPMVGAPVSYSADDLRAIAAGYDAESAPAPVVIGHPLTDTPAYGWATGFEFDDETERLFATVGEIEPAFADAIRAGRYKKVSMSFFKPEAENNPAPGSWYPKHIGFLGGAAPAVSGLKPVAFQGTSDDAVTFTADFGEPGFEQVASLFRNLRDFFIEKFGLETADKVLPAYRLEWLDDTEVDPAPTPIRTPTFAETTRENPVPKPDTAAFAAREAGLTTREKAIADRERELRHADNLAFAETLASEGRIAPVQKDRVAALLDAVPEDASVAFAGEKEKTLGQALRDILAAQPKIVSFGMADLGEDDDGAAVSFAADGKQVDPEGLKLHAKALAYQRAHPGTSYNAAVDAVI